MSNNNVDLVYISATIATVLSKTLDDHDLATVAAFAVSLGDNLALIISKTPQQA